MKAEAQINRLISQCQDLQDVAYDLHPRRDAERIASIDESIAAAKREIEALRWGRALGYHIKGSDED
jgi:predicted deacylase